MAAKYDRIATDLRAKIATGAYAAGQRLPAEDALGGAYGVSVGTIRKSLEVLEAEGLIDRQHGTGTFVKEKRQRLKRVSDRYQWEKDQARLPAEERGKVGATEYDTGLSFDELVFSARYGDVTADADIAAAFRVSEGTPMIRRIYETFKAGERAPLGIGTSYLLGEMVDRNPDLRQPALEPWPGGTHNQLYTVGVEIDHIVDQVTARPSTASEAERLDIRPGAPLLALRKTSFDIADKVVEVADVIWPGDRMEMLYTTRLERWHG